MMPTLNNDRGYEPENDEPANIGACPASLASWFCLNGATCFEVRIADSNMYNCWCRSGFHGLRCDYKYSSSSSDAPTTETVISNQTSAAPPPTKFITRDDMLLLGRRPLGHQQLAQFQANKGAQWMLAHWVPLVLLIVLLVALVLALAKSSRNRSAALGQMSSSAAQSADSIDISRLDGAYLAGPTNNRSRADLAQMATSPIDERSSLRSSPAANWTLSTLPAHYALAEVLVARPN